MSRTTLAVAFAGGFEKGYEFQNGWGSAPFIWDKLAQAYGITGDHRSRWPNVWKYHSEGKPLEPFEHNALVTTYDRYVVQRGDMLAIADSFEQFVEAHPPGDRVCTLLEQAVAIREAYAQGGEFLAWNQTSVCEEWFWSYMDDDEGDRINYDPRKQTEHTVADVITPFKGRLLERRP